MEYLKYSEEAPEQNKIIYQLEGVEVVVDPKDVDMLFNDLQKYNDQFSMGAMMARALGSMLQIYEEQTDESSAQLVENEEPTQQFNALLIATKHKNTLENMGIGLEPVKVNATMFVAGDKASSGQMRMNIVDGERLLLFLGGVSEGHLNNSHLKDNLVNLTDILTSQISDRYNFNDMVLTDEMYQLFTNIDKIIEHYNRLGLQEKVIQLATYLEHGKTGDLREYIFAERAGLFKEPGKNFGPADWQCDSTPEALRFRWNNALQILELTKANPNATKLFDTLKAHLLECVNFALSDLSRLNFLSEERRKESEQVLVDAKAVLGG